MSNSKFKDVVEAYDFLCNHTYFTKPYYDKEGNIFSFGNEFLNGAGYIYPTYDSNENIVFGVEIGNYDIESKSFYHNWARDFYTETWEKAILQLADIIYKDFGDDRYMSYFTVHGDMKYEKIEGRDDCQRLILPKTNWDIERLMNKIKYYDEFDKKIVDKWENS